VNSPAEVPEVQVADGEEDVYLWPNAEIRQRALDAIVKRAERMADERYRAMADKVLADVEAKVKQANENFIKQAAEVSAAYTRLDGLITKAEQAGVRLQAPPEPSPPPLPLSTTPEIHNLEEKIREIGQFFYALQIVFNEIETELSSKGIYDSELKNRLIAAMLLDRLKEDLPDIRSKVSSIISKLGIYSAW
jgi:hypothetical protein